MAPDVPDNVRLSPSLICLDLCRLEEEVRELEQYGLDMLHVDLLDGYFSPSMPIGLDIVSRLKTRTKLPFDVHLMVMNPDFFLRQCIAIGARRICFHCESTIHIEHWVTLIKANGIEAGIALAPATPLNVLEYLLDELDFVLLMLINPGFAGDKNEKQIPYAVRKVADCRKLLQKSGRHIPIEVDGRVSFDNIPKLVAAGADCLVAGTSCLFSPAGSREENLSRTRRAIAEGMALRYHQQTQVSSGQGAK